MSDIRQQLFAAFEVEHREHIESMRAALAQLAAGAHPDMRDVFRHAHSLKGAARAVDLPDVERMGHQLETLFAKLESGELVLDARGAQAVERALDGIETYVAAHKQGGARPDLFASAAAIAAYIGGTVPEVEVGAAPAAEETARPAAEPAAEYLRINAAQVERLSASMHDLMRELQNTQTAGLRQLRENQRALRKAWDGLRTQLRLGAAPALTARLTAFDEMLRGFERGIAAAAEAQAQSEWAIGEAAKQVRNDVDQVSLLPAETVFGDLGRMVRTLAREQDRRVSFTISGLDVQADRSVLQSLRDPVIHILRNAVSHGGSEAPETRAAKGKPAELQITVTISSPAGRLLIAVSDDGPGPDAGKIRAVAVSRHMGDERWRTEAPEEEILQLVFEPGFSTATALDTLSGRGIGLSAVAETVRRLRGRVRFRRHTPAGAETIIETPLSAARQPLLFVEWAGQRYGLPAYGVERLLRLKPSDIATPESSPAIRIETGGEDVVIPLVPLGGFIRSARQTIFENAHAMAVLLRHGTQRLAVMVDAFLDVRIETVNIGSLLGETDIVTGTVLMPNDVPALVLDPARMVLRWQQEGQSLTTGITAETPQQAHHETRTILVVDDSFTTRTLEKSILEAQGYRVLLSVDGIAALTTLRAEGALVDLVVADVEMPRLDGYGLLQAMKNDPRLATIPVILVTSRDDPENIRRGLELGAGAYITKQKFDQRELLTSISQLL